MKSGAVCYMAKSPEGILAVSIGGHPGRQDVRNIMARVNEPETWRQLYRQGWRIVKVDVAETES